MLSLHLLGGMELVHAGARLPLPQSRKTRALLALLAMAERPLRRERLCEMFWQIPDDPKGALRWSLSKLRGLLAADGAAHIRADRSEVTLVRDGLAIDARTLRAAAAGAPQESDVGRLEALSGLCRGGFLDDLDLPDAFEFRAWRIALRDELRAAEIRVRSRLLELQAGQEGAIAQAFRLVEIAPEQEAHHRALVVALQAAGEQREAEEQRRRSLLQLRDLGIVPSGALAAGRPPARPAARGSRERTTSVEEPDEAPVAAAAPAAPRATVPMLTVAGFRTLAPGGADDALAGGLTEEVTRALGCMPWSLTVIEPAAAGPEVDYVLSGTLLRAGERLRVNYRLLERVTGQHRLADRIEVAAADLLAAQDEVAGRIAGSMEPAIRLAEDEALRRRAPAVLGPYDHYLRGRSLAFGATGMDMPRAIRHFEAALRLDPAHAPSAIMLAWLGMQQPANFNFEGMCRCADLARTALRFANNDGAIIAHSAYVLMFCERDWDAALALVATASRLSPNSPQVWFASGWVHLGAGNPREALTCFDRALAFSVVHPFTYVAQAGRANALLQAGEPVRALAAARAAVNDNPTFHPAWRVLAAALALTGAPERAATAVARLRALAPHETVAFVRRWLPYRRPEQLDLLSRALTAAGLP